jgi:ABC-type bacteriocin/lantibiotic exporter with double-glycine peptidase domain
MLQLASSLVVSLFIVILLIITNPVLALFTSVTFVLVYLIVFSFVKRFLSKKGKERFTQNQLKYKYINEAFGGIKDIKVLGKENVFLELFSAASKKLAMADAMSDVVNEIPKYLLETIAFSGILSIIIFMITSGMKVEDFLPILTIYAFGAYRLLPSLQKIFRAIASIKFNFQVVLNLHKDFTVLPDGDVLISSDIMDKLPFNENIDLRNIVFRYPNANKNVINNQNISIKANSSIAFVGSTGCGKTTLVDIILGLLEPQSGKIFIDGVEICESNRRAWQKNLGYVPQSIYLLDDSIRHNIAFGVELKKIDDDAVIEAAKLANIHDFIMSELENGYDTLVGERGVRLSGGQRQRIGIARAVYHNPSVLILDEATSALDGLTENTIMDAITNIRYKKTIIMIAHRLTTVKQCDTIYFMEKGTIVGSGSYEELYK